MELCIQDPKYPNSYSLHEALLRESTSAVQGGAVYAFVSAGGVKLFLESEKLQKLLNSGKFQLVVGIDEITNINTLSKLEELQKRYSNLEVLAFLNNASNSLFHPKFCWFKYNDGGSLITGSGNLTEKGLRKNREIFNVQKVNSKELSVFLQQWNDWLDYNKELLKPINDEEVIRKAESNKIVFSSESKGNTNKTGNDSNDETLQKSNPETFDNKGNEIDADDFEAWKYQETDEVLICELPKNGDRFKQANFDKNSFFNFFGADNNDKSKIILFRSLDEDGFLGELEERPAVSVVSQNYRFELEALSGIKYPKEGKPIGVFVKIMTRMILYTIVMPNNKEFIYLKQFLYKNSSIQIKGRMKRFNTNIKELRKNCGGLSICKF